VLLSEVQSQPLGALKKSAATEDAAQGVVFSTLDEALERARQQVAGC